MVAPPPATAIALDVSTLLVIAIAVSALLGAFLLLIWHQERVQSLAWWGAAYLLGGFSVSLWSFQGLTATMPALPNMLLFLACGMVWSAARLFHGRAVLWAPMLAGSALWFAAFALTDIAHDGTARIALSSMIVAAYTFLTALELWRERRKSSPKRWHAVLVPAIHGAVFLVPAPLATMLPQDFGMAGFSNGWFGVFVLEAILYLVGAAFIVLMMSKERSLHVEKNAAFTDSLTGLPNRRAFFEGARKMKATQTRRRQPIAALMFDLDHFKSINDEYGHFVGDEVLLTFAAVISTTMRGTDLIARFGGEEFVALLPGSVTEAAAAAERVRAMFEQAGKEVGPHVIGATVSVGVADAVATGDLSALLIAADVALYRAKTCGRNRVCRADQEEPGEIELAPAGATIEDARQIIMSTLYARPPETAPQATGAT